MRIEHLDLPDDIVLEAERRWPEWTWSALATYGLQTILELARDHDQDQP